MEVSLRGKQNKSAYLMDMKRFILCFAMALGTCMALCAQSPSQNMKELRLGIGVRGPVGRSLGWGSSEIFSLTYARYGMRGIGYRVGAEYMPQNMEIDSYFGVPVAFSVRTRDRSFSESVVTGVEAAAAGAVRDAIYGYEPTAQSIIGDFLLGLLNRAEFFAGLTPGYIAGTNTPVKESYSGSVTSQKTMRLDNRFSITADVGFSMSFRIGRVNLGIVPSVHYFLTKNFVSVTSSGNSTGDGDAIVTETPVRFQYSVLGAIGYTF